MLCTDGEFVLNSIFDAMVLTAGIDELSTIKHVDRLKKDIRVTIPVLSRPQFYTRFLD